ncbi:MAG: YdbH domain-containing protein, partial [Alphaproteobacteria bacterium]|nr:YdbH domain-containing protein [Alphaproteobacteria bacterium]
DTALRSLGFSSFTLPKPTVKGGTARYESIPLDPQGLNEIKSLTIEYGWLRALLKRKPSSITINGLSLTGESGPFGKNLSVPGWPLKHFPLSYTDFPAARLRIENASLSFLTPEMGGISIQYDLQASPKGGNIVFEGHLKSAQRQLSYEAALSGYVDKTGQWRSRLEILESKLELPYAKASRMSGSITLSGSPTDQLRFMSDVQAGGLSLMGTPWHSAAATVEGTLESFNIYVGAKSTGIEGLEIALNIHGPGPKIDVSGSLYAQQLSALFDYLEAQNRLLVDRAALYTFDPLKDVNIEFRAQEGEWIYYIKNAENFIDIKGKIKKDKSGNISGDFTSSPISINAGKGQDTFQDGRMTLSGTFSRTPDQTAGLIKADLRNFKAKAGFLPAENINGQILIDDPETLSSSKNETLSCRLPLKRTIEQNCTLETTLNSATPKIKALNAAFFGGQFEASGDEKKQLISLKSLKLESLLKALDLKAISGQGTLDGSALITNSNGKPIIEHARLFNNGPGTIKLAYNETMGFLQGDPFEVETMKLALENYHYDLLDITLKGPVDGPLDITLNTKGRNPDILNAHPVALNIHTQVTLEQILSPLLPMAEKKPAP